MMAQSLNSKREPTIDLSDFSGAKVGNIFQSTKKNRRFAQKVINILLKIFLKSTITPLEPDHDTIRPDLRLTRSPMAKRIAGSHRAGQERNIATILQDRQRRIWRR